MAYIGRDIQYGVLDKQTLTGANGSKTQWTDLIYGVGSASSLLVSVGGVIQEPDVAYTASGTVLTFTEAPETGDTVYVVYLGKELSVATFADNSVTTAKIVDANVTTAKIADANVTTAKIADANVTDAKLAASGTMPAWDGSALTNLPAGGDKRNFIIDGDFTQWPEGTSRNNQANGDYGPALWRVLATSSTVRTTVTQETSNLPSDAKTGMTHEVTTGDASVGASERWGFRYSITGTDYAQIHNGVTVTFQFDLLSTDGGVFGVAFQNSAGDRTYVKSFTSTANTWETHSVSFATDTSGTWLFTEADVGMHIYITMQAGTGYKTGTENQWNGDGKTGATSNANHVSGTGKFIRMTNVGLYKGSSAPDSFIAEPISTVKDQVDYYVQRWDLNTSSNEIFPAATASFMNATNTAASTITYRREMRATPTATSSAFDTWAILKQTSSDICDSSVTIDRVTRLGCRFKQNYTGTPHTVGQGFMMTRDGTDTTWFMVEARH